MRRPSSMTYGEPVALRGARRVRERGTGKRTDRKADTAPRADAHWKTNRPETVEIPHLLLGFAEPDTFVGAPMIDSGRGTFTLSGRPVTEPGIVAQLDLADDETAIEVPKLERAFYGATRAG